MIEEQCAVLGLELMANNTLYKGKWLTVENQGYVKVEVMSSEGI